MSDEVPNKRWGCLRWLMLGAGIMGIILAALGVLMIQSVNWVKNAPEPAIAVYPKIEMSSADAALVQRIWSSLQAAKKNNAIIDEQISPDVFNALFEKIIEEDRKKGKIGKDAQVLARLAFDGGATRLRVSAPARDLDTGKELPGMYYNAEAAFDFEVEDGVLKDLTFHKLLLKNTEPPFLARRLIYRHIEELKRMSALDKDAPSNDLAMFKLLKRSGDKLHVVIDGKKLK
jgi:hypothetical protein